MSGEKFSDLKADDKENSLGKTIKDIILSDDTFIVYMDTNDVIQWSATSDHETYGKDFGNIQAQISNWEMLSNKIFSKDEAYGYKCLLAEAYATMLDEGNDAGAQNFINKAASMISRDGQETLKHQYLLSGFLLAASLGLVLIFSVLYLGKNLPLHHLKNTYEIFISGLLGGIGAFTSMVIRSKNYNPDIYVSKGAPQFDGLMRIVFGLLAGVLIAIGIKANVVFGFVNTSQSLNIFVLAFWALVWGASEIILPSIIKQIEDKT